MNRSFLRAILLIVLLSCEDNTPSLTIPYAPVSFTIDLIYDYSLRDGLSFKVFTEPRVSTDRLGYAGLLIVADAAGSTIYAYDLCCPYEDNRNIRVTPRGDGKAYCPECNSVFVTMFGDSGFGFGTPEKGPSKERLQSYHVNSLEPGIFRITDRRP